MKTIAPLTDSDLRRFWAFVDKSGGVLDLDRVPGHRNGYGQFGLDGKIYTAPRISYFLATGTDPLGLKVLPQLPGRR